MIRIKARANARALACGLAVGAIGGVVLGGAYLAGDAARRADTQAQTLQFAGAAAQGFSAAALRGEIAEMDPGALTLAETHAPYAITGIAQNNRQSAVFAGPAFNPSSSQGASGLLRASFNTQPLAQARPFHLNGGAQGASRDLECLADAVYYEARGETPAGQAAVAQVVLNRVRHPAFPKSVCGVVFQGAAAGDACQFSFACDGSMSHPREPVAWQRAREVAAHALAGNVMPSVGNATHFHVVGLDPGWGPRLLRVAQIGLHVFYRFGGYAGAPGSFTAQPQRSGPASEPIAHAVYASILPVGAPAADGRQSGQYILANVTITADGSKPVAGTAAATSAAPVTLASAAGHDASTPAPAHSSVLPAVHADDAAKIKPDVAAKPENTAAIAKPTSLAAL